MSKSLKRLNVNLDSELHQKLKARLKAKRKTIRVWVTKHAEEETK